MELKKYCEESIKTVAKLDTVSDNFVHMVLGITTELGEILDLHKKNLAYKKEFDWVNYKEELGDIMWYVVNFSNMVNHVLDDQSLQESALNIYYNSNFPGFKNKEKNSFLISELYKMNSEINLFYMIYIEQKILNTAEVKGICDRLVVSVKLICKILNFDFYNVLQTNYDKLQDKQKGRYKDGFTEEAALNRNLDTERKILEK